MHAQDGGQAVPEAAAGGHSLLRYPNRNSLGPKSPSQGCSGWDLPLGTPHYRFWRHTGHRIPNQGCTLCRGRSCRYFTGLCLDARVVTGRAKASKVPTDPVPPEIPESTIFGCGWACLLRASQPHNTLQFSCSNVSLGDMTRSTLFTASFPPSPSFPLVTRTGVRRAYRAAGRGAAGHAAVGRSRLPRPSGRNVEGPLQVGCFRG